MNLVGDRLHWIGGAGDDMVAAYYSIGIRTFSSSIATVAPPVVFEASRTGEAGARRSAHGVAGSDASFHSMRCAHVAMAYEVSAMKAMMDMVGLNGGPVRPPLVNVSAEEEDELRTILATWENFFDLHVKPVM